MIFSLKIWQLFDHSQKNHLPDTFAGNFFFAQFRILKEKKAYAFFLAGNILSKREFQN
jgi:hypothetical protein